MVSQIVAKAVVMGLKANQITTEMIDDVAIEANMKPLLMPASAVRHALDPVENVKDRKVIGGPAPVEVRRMLNNRRDLQVRLSERLQKHLDDLQAANEKLDCVARQIAAELVMEPVVV